MTTRQTMSFPRQFSITVPTKKKKKEKKKFGADERKVHCCQNRKKFHNKTEYSPQLLSIVNSKVSCYMFFSLTLNISKKQKQPEKALFMVSYTNSGLVKIKDTLCNLISVSINNIRANSTLY